MTSPSRITGIALLAAGLAAAGLAAQGARPPASPKPGEGGRQATPAAPADPCAAPANKIVAENCKPGQDSTEWDINGNGDPSIQGFATDISVNHGETVGFKVRTNSPRYASTCTAWAITRGSAPGGSGRSLRRPRCRSGSRSAPMSTQ